MIVASTVQPGVNPSGSAPMQTSPPSTVPGVCNSYLPEDTTLNRFMFVVKKRNAGWEGEGDRGVTAMMTPTAAAPPSGHQCLEEIGGLPSKPA